MITKVGPRSYLLPSYLLRPFCPKERKEGVPFETNTDTEIENSVLNSSHWVKSKDEDQIWTSFDCKGERNEYVNGKKQNGKEGKEGEIPSRNPMILTKLITRFINIFSLSLEPKTEYTISDIKLLIKVGGGLTCLAFRPLERSNGREEIRKCRQIKGGEWLRLR